MMRKFCINDHDIDSRNPGSCKRAQTADSRVAQESEKAFPSASGWRFGEGWGLRLPDCAQAPRESTDHQRTHEDTVPGWADSSQANQKVDLLQARRSQNPAN